MTPDPLAAEQNDLAMLLKASRDRDPAAWDDYVRHASFRVNLRGADLTGKYLREFNLTQADLEGSVLTASDLTNASLFAAKLMGADLAGASLNWADLSSADLTFARLAGARMFGTRLKNASLVAATMTHAHVDRAEIIATDLRLANLAGTDLTRAFVRGAICTQGDISGLMLAKEQYLELRLEPMPESRLLKLQQLTGRAGKLKAGAGRNPHAFISYVLEDAPRIDRLVAALGEYGINTWRDKNALPPGADWSVEIARAIENGAFFVACFSTNYWTRHKTCMNEELNVAIEQVRLRRDDARWFIPVKLDDCSIPDFTVRPGRKLTSFQFADLSQNWDEGLQRLVVAILSENPGRRSDDAIS